MDVRPGLVHLDLGLGVGVLDGGIGVGVLERGTGVGALDRSTGADVVERGSALLDFKTGCKVGVVCLVGRAGVGGLVWGAEVGAGFERVAGVLDGDKGVLDSSAEVMRTLSPSERA